MSDAERQSPYDEEAIRVAEQLESLYQGLGHLVTAASDGPSVRLQQAIERIAEAGRAADRAIQADYGID